MPQLQPLEAAALGAMASGGGASVTTVDARLPSAGEPSPADGRPTKIEQPQPADVQLPLTMTDQVTADTDDHSAKRHSEEASGAETVVDG